MSINFYKNKKVNSLDIILIIIGTISSLSMYSRVLINNVALSYVLYVIYMLLLILFFRKNIFYILFAISINLLMIIHHDFLSTDMKKYLYVSSLYISCFSVVIFIISIWKYPPYLTREDSAS